MFICQWSIVHRPNYDPTLRARLVHLYARAADIASAAFASRDTGGVFDPDARHTIDNGDFFDDFPARGVFA